MAMVSSISDNQDTNVLYRQHRLGRGQIRVLRLLPGDLTTSIQCVLEVVSLSALHTATTPTPPGHVCNTSASHRCVCYEALSYTWGPRYPAADIKIDDVEEFPVTPNLHDALMRLRQRDSTRRLWIDAICINQLDVTERDEQVELMREIYSLAQNVVVWLGDECPTPADISAHLSKQATDYSGRAVPPDLARLRIQNHGFDTEAAMMMQAAEILAIVSAPGPRWWRRSWVQQEFVLSRKSPRVAFRSYDLEWEAFYSFVQAIGPFQLRVREDDGYFEFLRMIESVNYARTWYYRDHGHPLMKLLLHSAGLEVTDLKDRVYSVLGMVREEEAGLIRVRYSLTASQVIMNAMMAICANTRSLYWMGLIRPPTPKRAARNARSAIEGLPTWCPDFSSLETLHQGWRMETDDVKPMAFWQLLNIPEMQPCPLRSLTLTFPSTSLDGADLLVRGLKLGRVGQLHMAKSLSDISSIGLGFCSLNHHIYPQRRSGLQWPFPCSECRWSCDYDIDYEQLPIISILGAPQQSLTAEQLELLLSTWTDRFLTSPPTEGSLWFWQYYAQDREDWNINYDATDCNIKVLVLDTGFTAFAPDLVSANDVLVLLAGSSAPVVLREEDEGVGTYSFRGFAYVHGIMERELWELYPGLEPELEDFRIV